MANVPPTESSSARLKRATQRVGLLLGTLVLSLAVLEIGTRLFTNTHAALDVRHPVIGKIHWPNFQGSVYVDEAGREVFMRFNREGFRGPDVPYARADDVRRVAVLGDSMVASVACDEADTAVGQLERLLNGSHAEPRWEVLNFGVSGASTGQALVLYREVVSQYRPDLVIVVYFMGNDFSDNTNRLSKSPRIYFEIDEQGRLVQQPFSVTRKKVSAWLNLHSRFYVWQKKKLAILRERGLGRSGYWIFSTEDTDELADAWRLNLRLIREFRDEVERRGSRFVLVLYPAGEQVYDDQWQKVLAQAGERADRFDPDFPDRRLTRFAAEQGIPLVGLTEAFRGAPTDHLLFFNRNGHFNEAGNLQAAREIHRFLTEGDGREILD